LWFQQAETLARQFATRLALIAFATSVLRGLILGGDFEACIKTALGVMAVFFAVGLMLGELARRLVEDSIEAGVARWQAANTQANPDPGIHRP